MGDWEPVNAPAPLDLFAQGLGVQAEPFSPAVCTFGSAPATQLIFGTSIYLVNGATITGIKMRLTVAAAGILPATARFGLLDHTGKVLVRSGNLTALANWVTGVCPFPFTAPYVIPSSGIYIACFVVNGVWGTTQPTPLCTAITEQNLALAADGSSPPFMFGQSGQTDLPAVGSSVTLGTASARTYYLAPY
jgi:hypothetical protein